MVRVRLAQRAPEMKQNLMSLGCQNVLRTPQALCLAFLPPALWRTALGREGGLSHRGSTTNVKTLILNRSSMQVTFLCVGSPTGNRSYTRALAPTFVNCSYASEAIIATISSCSLGVRPSIGATGSGSTRRHSVWAYTFTTMARWSALSREAGRRRCSAKSGARWGRSAPPARSVAVRLPSPFLSRNSNSPWLTAQAARALASFGRAFGTSPRPLAHSSAHTPTECRVSAE